MLKYFLTFILVAIIGTSAWFLKLYSDIRFDIDKIVNYNPLKTTQFYDKNGKLIANVFAKEDRLYVKYKDIPARIIEALVAIEDTQFFEHNGINLDAISRALIKDIKVMKLVEGASTLTQQLVRTLALTREKKFIRKIKEILLSIRLETILTKEEILERYLNQSFFGHGYYGIKTAARGYFKKSLYELNLKEIAMLTGILQAPSFYTPTRNLKFALVRANQVIKRMYNLGWINEKEYENAINYIPIVYSQSLTQNKAPYIIDYALKLLQKDIPDIKTGGYTINLTIDLDAQRIARKSLKFGYDKIIQRDKQLQKNPENNIIKKDDKEIEVQQGYFVDTLNGAMVSIENNTGKILALVGGVDYKNSSYNRAVQAKRQPGSSIKPFFYYTALELGYSPASQIADIGRTYDYKIGDKNKKWQPKNYTQTFKGVTTLREALVKSKNLATINLVNDVGITEMHKALKRYSIKNIPRNLSIALGSFSISPIKFSKAYSMFSNGGIQVNPYLISSITNKDNETINFEPQTNYIGPEEEIFLTNTMLMDVVKRGTGRRARVKGIELSGKTGTTNNYTDAWFCGFSPSIQTIIWFGKDNNLPMRQGEGGGKTAAPVFSHFYKEYLKIHPEIKRKFIKPQGVKVSIIKGKKEYYTDISPLPQNQAPIIQDNSKEIREF